MRRQSRISIGGALVVRTASALQVWLWLLIFVFQNEFRISRSIQPGYLDFDNLPETNFTCTGKVIGGYYADLETSCQMFHVCTVGQQEEPMDIKFLCLNGTVFDQETRVCERVDEVDCTKSEKFYSLNLELYGSSTAPPLITPDQQKPQAEPTAQNNKQTKPSQENDPSLHENTTKQDKVHQIDIIDSTEDPIQDIKKDNKFNLDTILPTHPSFPTGNEEFNEEYEEEDEIDSENTEYEEDYSNYQTTTTTSIPTTTAKTTTTKHPITTTVPSSTSVRISSPISHIISSPTPTISLLPAQAPITSSAPSSSSIPTLDPSLLSPQEFIYRHRGPGSEAISFQRQSFRPADGVYITHAPPQQFDHFQYESSRTAPRPAAPRPVPFVQRPQPAPFRPTTLDPRDQQLRPGPTSQPSERYETSIKHRPQPYPSPQTAQRPIQYNPYYYERKRSDDSLPQNESSLSARSVAPPVNERTINKPKSPPRVIVTASASVSDSNGKRLNYTVGNVVNAVKPIVPINYDDYKESDLIFDPFFLDVPKLQKQRKTRSNQYRQIFTVPATTTTTLSFKSTTKDSKMTTLSPVSLKITTIERSPTNSSTPITTTTPVTTTSTAAWNPDDYVDDNYEAHAYIPPMPPLAVLMIQDSVKSKKHDKSKQELHANKAKIGHTEKSMKPTSAAQLSSSQSAAPFTASPQRLPLEAKACATLRSNDCRTRA